MAPRATVPIRIVLVLATLAGRTRAGEPPLLAGVYPPGATVGRDVAWTLTGSNMERVRSVVVSGEGVEVVGLRHCGPGTLTATVRVGPDAAPDYRDVRLDGPDGVSNALIVRVDALPQADEAEPNDEPGLGQEIGVDASVAGRLGPLDRDHYRVRGVPGQRMTLDLEVRRLGSSFAPVVTVSSGSGRAIAQGREIRGGDRDCRMEVAVPPDGSLVIQVRDNLHGGGDHAAYRLRVRPSPGRPPPDTTGRRGPDATSIRSGDVVIGTIEAPGAVSLHRLAVGTGEEVVVGVEADPPGSRLDPVATARDAGGVVLGENDDTPRVVPGSPLPATSTRSTLRFESDADQEVTLEVADRFGGGGVDFGYRMAVGSPRPDFAAFVVPEGSAAPGLGPSSGRRITPGRFGVFNVRPGSEPRVDFAIVSEGFSGPVEVEVRGLPEGVAAEPTTIRVASTARPAIPTSQTPAAISRGTVWLEVDREARPGLGYFELVATGRPPGGEAIRRPMIAVIDAATSPGVTRTISRFPIRILGP